MESYYSQTDLLHMARQIADEARTAATNTKLLYRTALDRLIELPALAVYRKELQATSSEGVVSLSDSATEEDAVADSEQLAATLFEKGTALARLGRVEEELEVICCRGPALRGDRFTSFPQVVLPGHFCTRASLFGQLGRIDEELVAYDEVNQRFADTESPTLFEWVAKALLRKGFTLGQVGREEESLAVYDELSLSLRCK